MGAVVELAARREGLGWRFGARARALNILAMVMTLDVSKFSSPLNFTASCRVARERSYDAGWGTAGRREGGGRGGGASRTQGSRSAGGGLRAHAP